MFFSVLYLGEELKWNYILGFGLSILEAFVIFHKWQDFQSIGENAPICACFTLLRANPPARGIPDP